MNMEAWDKMRALLKEQGISVAEAAKRVGYSDTGLRAGVMGGGLKRPALQKLAQMVELEPAALEAHLFGSSGGLGVVNEPPAGYSSIKPVAQSKDELDLLRALFPHRKTLQKLIDNERKRGGDE